MTEQLVEVGCLDCGQKCQYNDITDPPLDRDRAQIWFALHQLVCPCR